MCITIKELRELISNTIGFDLKEQGFSIDKSLTWLNKKVDKNNKIRVLIDCYKYSERIEFRLVFEFLIDEIEKRRKFICQYFNEEYVKSYNITLSEGFFFFENDGLSHIYQSSFTHKLADLNSAKLEIEKCRLILKQKIIPKLDTFSKLSNFQEYVMRNYKKFGEDTFTFPSIISMMLSGDQEFYEIIGYFKDYLDCNHKPKDYLMRIKIDKIIKYKMNSMRQ